MSSFEEAYKKLNTEQKMAVDTIDGPLLVIAGPGTGKTELLSVRVAHILEETDTDANSILCVTFTQKAALNMRERLNRLIGPESRHVNIQTFHSFAAGIMNEYPDYFWSGAELSTAPDAVQDEIIQTILAKLPLDNPLASTFAGTYTALNDVKQGLKLTKEAGLTPEELRMVLKENLRYIKHIEPILVDILTPALSAKNLSKIQNAVSKLPKQTSKYPELTIPLNVVLTESLEHAVSQDTESGKTTETSKWKRQYIQSISGKKGMFNEIKRNEWWLATADVYESYRNNLHDRGYYDYADMLVEVLEQLKVHPELLADVQERYLYVLIDEFQDTNAAQLRLARLVADHYAANGRPNLMAVGDDDQSIFAFNGAELSNVLDFRRSYPDTKVVVLSDNYRSSQEVLDVSQQIINQAEGRLVNRESDLTKNLIAKSKFALETEIKHLSYPTRYHQYSALAKSIKQLWDKNEKDIAVLAREHSSLKQLAGELLRQGIPVRYEQQSNILEQEAIKQVHLIAQAAVAIASGNTETVNVTLSRLLRHPMWEISAAHLWKIALANYSSPDWLEYMLESDSEQLQKIGHWFVWLARSSSDQDLKLSTDYILGLREGQYFTSPFRAYFMSKKPVTSEYLETLSGIAVLQKLVQEFSHNNPSLDDFVRFIELNLSTNRVITDESWFASDNQAVQLLTVYKAKGLEFDHVYVVDATEDMWKPRRKRRASPANLRLQSYGEKYDDYVRLMYVAASRAKRMFTATSYYTDEIGKEILPTSLLQAIPTSVIDSQNENPVKVLETGLVWPRLTTSNEKALLAERLEEYSLSATAFIDFLNVAESGPQNFLERHILRVPTPSSAAGSYGTSVHAALETAQRLFNNGAFEYGTVLDRFEATLNDQHLLPSERQRLQTKGEGLLSKLFENNVLDMKKGGLTEQKIDNVFIESARIKGTIDLINTESKSVVISDYKTGKPLQSLDTSNKSLLTKAWRHKTQLLFYALLTAESSRFKGKEITAQMVYLETDDAKPKILTITPTSAELQQIRSIIVKVWQKIQKLDFPDTSKYPQNHDGVVSFEQDLLNGKV